MKLLSVAWLIAPALAWIPLAAHVLAQPIKTSGQPAAKCGPIAGTMLARAHAKPWRAVKAGDSLASGSLVVGLPRCELIAANGAVHVHLLADVGQRGPFPVLEAGIVLHDAGDVDMDFEVERGLILIDNLKASAKVRLRVRDETWVLHLLAPQTKVAMEIFGRHAPGLPKVIDAKMDVPTTDVLMLVLAGSAFFDTDGADARLQAPPGVARLHWDSVGRQHTFQRLEKLPDNVVKPPNEREAQEFKDLAQAAGRLNDGDIGKALDSLLGAASATERMAGVTLAGAIDDLPRLFGVLATSKHADERNHAIIALRHWLGREPGQIMKLQKILLDERKLTPVQARNALQLMIGFDAEERAHADTYSLLIHFLDHQKQSVRTLAYWHLVRLAPAGKDIPYDPAATEEERRPGLQRWQALIPEGQLPPLPKEKS